MNLGPFKKKRCDTFSCHPTALDVPQGRFTPKRSLSLKNMVYGLHSSFFPGWLQCSGLKIQGKILPIIIAYENYRFLGHVTFLGGILEFVFLDSPIKNPDLWPLNCKKQSFSSQLRTERSVLRHVSTLTAIMFHPRKTYAQIGMCIPT